jgi:hypothetical protein
VNTFRARAGCRTTERRRNVAVVAGFGYLGFGQSRLSGCVPNRECVQFRFDRLPNIRRFGSALEPAKSRDAPKYWPVRA